MRYQPTVNYRFDIRWDHEVIDGEHYVNEHHSIRRGFDRYGPMPESMVLPLIAERRAYWADVQERLPKMMQDSLFPQFGPRHAGAALPTG